MTEFSMKIPEEMRKKYIERRARDALALERALESGDFEFLAKMGHQLKGNASTFGYEALADLGRRMEEAVKNRSMSAAAECLCVLKAWVHEQTYGMGEDG